MSSIGLAGNFSCAVAAPENPIAMSSPMAKQKLQEAINLAMAVDTLGFIGRA
jgi:hypothetical protein